MVGIIITFVFVPDMTGVDFADEDARFMKFLVQNGWEGEVGENDERALVRKGTESRSTDEPMYEKTPSV